MEAGKNAGEVTVIYRKQSREQKPGEMALFTCSLHLFTAMPEGQSAWTTFIHNVSLCQDFINTQGSGSYVDQQNMLFQETLGIDDLNANIKVFLSS